MSLEAPLLFKPVYKVVLWGGRRFERWRDDLPAGAVGESWDLADHTGGMSVVESGPLAGTSLRALTERFGERLVGPGFAGGVFPIMIKLIDATDKLSVQVHPDDAIAQTLGVGSNGKTECWLVLEDGGELYQGTKAGVDRQGFQQALGEGRVADTLLHHRARAGEFYFMAARTVHALGAGCLVYELQQTLDVTFRVDDWGRVGADGQPRPMHVREALETIDFAAADLGPRQPAWQVGDQGRSRTLTDNRYFHLVEHEVNRTLAALSATCVAVTCLAGRGTLSTSGGSVALSPGRTALVPAAAGRYEVVAADPLRILAASPTL
jgi:mannose-6-phosphate isomerase